MEYLLAKPVYDGWGGGFAVPEGGMMMDDMPMFAMMEAAAPAMAMDMMFDAAPAMAMDAAPMERAEMVMDEMQSEVLEPEEPKENKAGDGTESKPLS